MLGSPPSRDALYWMESQLEGWRRSHRDHRRRYVRTLQDLGWHSLFVLTLLAIAWSRRGWIEQLPGALRHPLASLLELVALLVAAGLVLRREVALVSAACRRWRRCEASLGACREQESRIRRAREEWDARPSGSSEPVPAGFGERRGFEVPATDPIEIAAVYADFV